MLTAFMLKSQAEARKRACLECPEKRVTFGIDMCNQCGCIIAAKVTLRASTCPLNKWSHINEPVANKQITSPFKP